VGLGEVGEAQGEIDNSKSSEQEIVKKSSLGELKESIDIWVVSELALTFTSSESFTIILPLSQPNCVINS